MYNNSNENNNTVREKDLFQSHKNNDHDKKVVSNTSIGMDGQIRKFMRFLFVHRAAILIVRYDCSAWWRLNASVGSVAIIFGTLFIFGRLL